MKWIFLLTLFFLFISPGFSAEPIDIVFDIDWTIVSTIDTAKPFQVVDDKCFEVEGVIYRKADYLEKMMEDLLNRKDVRISFYSGGERSRNLKLLEEIRLSDGRTLKEIAYKILSKEELVRQPFNSETKFWVRYKKDLTKINPVLSNVILIDDIKEFTPEIQHPNMLWIQNKEYHFESFEKAKEALQHFPDDQFIPKTKEQWFKNHYRLLWVRDVLLSSLDEYEAAPAASFSQLVINKTHQNGLAIPLTAPSELKRIENFLNQPANVFPVQKSCLDYLAPFAL
jgi:hypothetical protein